MIGSHSGWRPMARYATCCRRAAATSTASSFALSRSASSSASRSSAICTGSVASRGCAPRVSSGGSCATVDTRADTPAGAADGGIAGCPDGEVSVAAVRDDVHPAANSRDATDTDATDTDATDTDATNGPHVKANRLRFNRVHLRSDSLQARIVAITCFKVGP